MGNNPINWKRRGLWLSGVTDAIPTPAPGSPPSPPPPGTPPAPTPTAPPIIDYQQVFFIRDDAAVDTELGPVLATRSPTSWSIESGNTGSTWQIQANGKLRLLAPLNATTNGSYVLYVKAYNPLPSEEQFVVITVTPAPAPAPAPGGGGTTGGIPNNIINLPADAAASLFTSGISSQETWPAGEWPSAVRSGCFIGENNTWAIRPGWWELTFIANGAASISAGQFHQRVGVSTDVGRSTLSYELHLKIPGGAKPAGAPSEVATYPCIGMGQLMSWGHRQLRLPPNVPRQCGSISALWTGAKSVSVAGTTCVGHWCDDMRIANSSLPSSTYNDAVAQITMEFMIVRRTFGGYGLGPGARPSGAHRGTLTIGGIQYYIFTQQGATDYGGGNFATLLCFVPTSGNLPDIVDYAHVIKFCTETRWNQLPNGPGSRFERGRNSGDFMIQPSSWLKHTFQGFEADATHAGEMHIVAGTAFYRMALD